MGSNQHSEKQNINKCVGESYSSVFKPGFRTLQGYESNIYVDPGAQLKYCKARSVPYAMRGKVKEECLVSEAAAAI